MDESTHDRPYEPVVLEVPVEPPRRRFRPHLGPGMRRWLNSKTYHFLLFALTLLTTLIVGTDIHRNYLNRSPVLDWNLSWTFFRSLLSHPMSLAEGIPFSFTLMAILLAHEFGHFFTCRYHEIDASFPYFVPAPTLIGTMGAFIRIRSPIFTRRALFDIGIAGPLMGLVVAIPCMLVAVTSASSANLAISPDSILMGSPIGVILATEWLRPGLSPENVIMHPVGCAAWVGLFVTALNLIPVGQLDGGHILYSIMGPKHRYVSIGLSLILFPLGYFFWPGWYVWAGLLLVLGLRHPRVMIAEEPLGRRRPLLALGALVLFLLCFTPAPFFTR
jgi:membrane-associated protease RseP (regulator of RpoE activity)